ncbi:MAG: glycoside hydrolase family 65 protein [Propionibacteriaceae bacterium]|nr:glycoside hydrolase family 65 protein [Propionibacteriaceae bacterium]
MTARTTAWSLVDDSVDSGGHAQTLFALGNGFLGARGAVEEDLTSTGQVFANGFYETWPIVYPEDAYGLARTGQTIQAVPDPTHVALIVDGHPFDPATATLREHRRWLDLRAGTLRRHATWVLPGGLVVEIESTRVVSTTRPECLAMEYAVTTSADAQVEMTHWILVPGRAAGHAGLDPRRSTALADATRVTTDEGDWARHRLVMRTRSSGIGVACSVRRTLRGGVQDRLDPVRTDAGVGVTTSVRLAAGTPLTLRVSAAYATDGPLLTDTQAPTTDLALVGSADRVLDDWSAVDWDDLLADQADALAQWWSTTDVEVGGDEVDQGAIRWNLFQTFQAVAHNLGHGIPAKGVSGSGYDGHAFWDTEAMVMPILTYTHPRMARSALSYRHRLLPRARERAAELHHAGALFPWRSIDGREASAFFEAGTAQYHIDADIAYAINRYLRSTLDLAYLTAEGAEILVETARMWASLGFFDSRGGFHIHGVTGPDEYSAMVDDNLFTNVMAAANFDAAAFWLEWLRGQDRTAWAEARRRFRLDDAEIASWRAASAAMTIPYDEALGVHGQDAHFLEHEVWDFAGTPREMYPLLLHFHPLTIYRHQVLKQADVVLALINRPDLFTPDQMRADFDYYDPLTTGDSTLSASTQAIMAATVGHLDLAEHYFRSSLRIDLDDAHGNTSDGVHVAAVASVWTTLVMGFGGFRDYGGYSLDPRLPEGWTRLAFHLRLLGALVLVEIAEHGVGLTVCEGDAVDMTVYGTPVRVEGQCFIPRP